MRNSRHKLKLIHLDGRTLEGGGQLLRLSICLSALTGIPVRVADIRGNRKGGGGLGNQHAACVKWLGQACGADVKSVAKGDRNLLFEPAGLGRTTSRAERKNPFFEPTVRDGVSGFACRLDIATAGSTGLALQAILPYILFSRQIAGSPVWLTMTGGTNASGSPSYEYLTQVFFPTLEAIGLPAITAKLHSRGWSTGRPTVGGFTLEIPPRTSTMLSSFDLYPADKSESPVIHQIEATFFAPADCHDRFRQSFLGILKTYLRPQLAGQRQDDLSPRITINIEDSMHPQRMYLIVVATLADKTRPDSLYKLASDSLSQRKITSSVQTCAEMIDLVASQLAVEIGSGARVDEHMRDQLVVFRALARGHTRVWPGASQRPGDRGNPRTASLHAQTAEWVAHKILGSRFSDAGDCHGVGFDGENWEDVPKLKDDNTYEPETSKSEATCESLAGLDIG